MGIEEDRRKRNEYARRWRAANPGKVKAWGRKWRAENPDKVRASLVKFWAKTKNDPAEYAGRYRRTAKFRGIVWNLDIRHAVDLLTDNCFYCGAAPNPVNGIDRVNNGVGYCEDNVVTACKRCNFAKHDQSVADFVNWAGRFTAHYPQWRRLDAACK